MVGELVMLPVRVGVQVTRLWFRAVEAAVAITSDTTGRAVGLLTSSGPHVTDRERWARESAGMEGDLAVSGRRRDARSRSFESESKSAPARHRPPRPEGPAGPFPAPVAEPVHVSEEPELVQELAEPGVEDGAGAEVRVDPPWDDYERMNAKEVISRLAGANPAQLAAVQLYEGSHRRRQTVLNAVERELRGANGSGARTNQTRGLDRRE